jgi:predicted component of type VI protein secretion system
MGVWMNIVRGSSARGRFLYFQDGACLVGRDPECQVQLGNRFVSRRHCLLSIRQQEATVRDLGSTNGTLVNGQRAEDEVHLLPGDTLQLGAVVLQLVAEANVPAEVVCIAHGQHTQHIALEAPAGADELAAAVYDPADANTNGPGDTACFKSATKQARALVPQSFRGNAAD